MCQYCDVRMPDASGMEMDGKRHLMRILIANNGYISVRAEGVSIPAPWDTFKVNYCPMCGKPLHNSNEPVNEPDYYYLVRDDCGEYSIYDRESMAKEFAEEVAANVGVAELIRVKVDTINTCEVCCCWDDE